MLAGAPNVGKSSLLNALARREAAIVSEEAGTTRDVIEVRLDVEGLLVVVSDTAGIRAPSGPIELEGIKRTLAYAHAADLIIWLSDARRPSPRPAAELAAARRRHPFRGQQGRSGRHRIAASASASRPRPARASTI